MDLAGYEISTAILARFRLDGGAMFGSVPRAVWERSAPPDAKNRIGLVARALTLRRDQALAVVDAGVGDKFGAKEAEMYAVEPTAAARLPFRWDEISDLVLTHLHFDHAGGATRWQTGGEEGPARSRRAVPSAPRARVHVTAANWAHAQAPGPRERASYLAENIDPLRDADLRLHPDGAAVLPDVTVHLSYGHTQGLGWILVGEGRGAVAFPADLVPTSAHVHLPFVMGYDMCVQTLMDEKESFLSRAAAEGWIVVFAHDENVPAARITRGADGRFRPGEVVAI